MVLMIVNIFIFIALHRILVIVERIFSCSSLICDMGSSSLTEISQALTTLEVQVLANEPPASQLCLVGVVIGLDPLKYPRKWWRTPKQIPGDEMA